MSRTDNDIIRTIAEALYRSTGAFPTYFTADDVRRAAKDRTTLSGDDPQLTDADCAEILNNMLDAADFSPHIEIAIAAHKDMTAEARTASVAILQEVQLKLSELAGSLSIAMGGLS